MGAMRLYEDALKEVRRRHARAALRLTCAGLRGHLVACTAPSLRVQGSDVVSALGVAPTPFLIDSTRAPHNRQPPTAAHLYAPQDGVTTRQKQTALYGSTAVHASFGDIELAQITLRGGRALGGGSALFRGLHCKPAALVQLHCAPHKPLQSHTHTHQNPNSSNPPAIPPDRTAEGIRNGLDFEQCLSDPDLPGLVTSPQMLIQLRRFNTTAQQALSSRAAAAGKQQQRGRISGTGGGGGGMAPLKQDLGRILGTPTSDTAEIDTSVMGAHWIWGWEGGLAGRGQRGGGGLTWV